jgi:hypothetical protein
MLWARRCRRSANLLQQNAATGCHSKKRSLPKKDHVIFDRLFDCAKLHIQAGVMVSRPWPFESIVMAILLEQHKEIERLERMLDAREGRGEA